MAKRKRTKRCRMS